MTVFSAAQEGVFGRRRDFAALDFNAANGTIFAPLTFTRASGAARVNERGYIEEVGANAARWEYDPALIYNLLPNPWADGGDNPPTLPNDFSLQPNVDIAPQYLGRGVRNGIPYTSWRVFVPSCGAAWGNIRFNNRVGTIPAALGDVFTGQFLIEITRIGSATSANLPRLYAAIAAYNAAGSTKTEEVIGSSLPITQSFSDGPIFRTLTISNSLAAWCQMQLLISTPSAGLTHDYDFDIGFPVLNRGATPLTDTVPLEKLIERRNGVAVYGLRGLLLEESGQNEALNPRMEGAVSGSPGTVPSNHGYISPDGAYSLTRTIAVGAEDGLSYVDYTWSGTASETNDLYITLANPFSSAAVGQTWTGSAFCKVIGSALPVNNKIRVREVGAAVYTATDVFFPSGDVPLSNARRVVTRTFTDAATNHVSIILLFRVTAGQTYNFTIRVAGTQLEQAGEATSLILPPVGSPGVSIRARDNFALPLMLPNLSRGTMAVRGQRISNKTYPSTKYGPVLNSGTTWNGVFGLFWAPNQARPSVQINSDGVTQATQQAPSGAAGAAYTAAIAWGDGSALMSFDGEPAVLDAAAASPTAFTTARGNGLDASATGTANFILKFLRVWGRKLSPGRTQQESARTE